jgi:hypothetical protein
MVRTFVTFGDIAGKLVVLDIECTKCPRRGRYHVDRLIEKYGRRGNLTKWLAALNGDCRRRDARLLHQRCDVRCPDLTTLRR